MMLRLYRLPVLIWAPIIAVHLERHKAEVLLIYLLLKGLTLHLLELRQVHLGPQASSSMLPPFNWTGTDKIDLLSSQWSWQTKEFYKIPCQSPRRLIPRWDQAPWSQDFRALQPPIKPWICRKLLFSRRKLRSYANFSLDRYTSQVRAQRHSIGNTLLKGERVSRSLISEGRTQNQRISDRLPWSRTMKMN
jgi:hypothetical protein